MIDCPCSLKAVGGHHAVTIPGACIIDQHVEIGIFSSDLGGETFNLALTREIGYQKIHSLVLCFSADLGARSFALTSIAADHNNPLAHASQCCGSGLSYSRIGACNEANFFHHRSNRREITK